VTGLEILVFNLEQHIGSALFCGMAADGCKNTTLKTCDYAREEWSSLSQPLKMTAKANKHW